MERNNRKPVVGFIGTGVMGRSMAGHIIQAGYPLLVHTRTRSKAEELIDQGALWHDSPATLAAAADVIITIVGFPSDVEEIYLGQGGIVPHARPGTLLIDMTTSSPALARTIHDQAGEKGIGTLDAPVSGGDIGAREARLSIMVGGTKEDFDKALPLFRQMGSNIVWQGPAGSGQHTKMANQIAIAAGMLGVCEALAYTARSGLDPETVLQSISGGAAGSWSLSNLGPRMIKGDFAPGFYVKHFLKDMGIARESAHAAGIQTPGLDLAHEMYSKLAADGGGELGTQGLFRLYQ
ncbi:MAG: NAD(P)-dependent oxidoreductase [Puniceicoccaceae bacterium]